MFSSCILCKYMNANGVVLKKNYIHVHKYYIIFTVSKLTVFIIRHYRYVVHQKPV